MSSTPEDDKKELLAAEMERLINEVPRGRFPHPFYIPLSEMFEVPLEKIVQAAECMGADTPNSFTMLLMTAEAYKSLNVEPVFLINQEQTTIRVAAREMWENPKSIN